MRTLFFIAGIVFALSACGVRGQLFLPGTKDQKSHKEKPQAVPFKSPNNASNDSVQKSDAEKEMLGDPYFTINPNGEYDIRGNINR